MNHQITVEIVISLPEGVEYDQEKVQQELADKLYLGAEHHPDDYFSVVSINHI